MPVRLWAACARMACIMCLCDGGPRVHGWHASCACATVGRVATPRATHARVYGRGCGGKAGIGTTTSALTRQLCSSSRCLRYAAPLTHSRRASRHVAVAARSRRALDASKPESACESRQMGVLRALARTCACKCAHASVHASVHAGVHASVRVRGDVPVYTCPESRKARVA